MGVDTFCALRKAFRLLEMYCNAVGAVEEQGEWLLLAKGDGQGG